MFKKIMVLLLVVCFMMIASGCATIIHGKLQNVSIATVPADAIVKASDGETCTTPGVLKLDRALSSYTLHIEKEGYKPIDITLRKDVDPWFFGNILIGGLIGIIVDLSTGAAYKFSPDDIVKVLSRKGIDTSRLDTKNNIYVFVDLKEMHPDLNLSELEKIN